MLKTKTALNPQQITTRWTSLDGPLQSAIGFFHAKIQQERQEPIVCRGIVIEREDLAYTRGIVGAWGQVRAEQKQILCPQHLCDFRQHELRFEVWYHPKKGDHL